MSSLRPTFSPGDDIMDEEATNRLIESNSTGTAPDDHHHHHEEDPDAFPWSQVLILSVVLFCNVTILNSWPPFSTWMVESFHLTDNDLLLGEYSGWLSGSFMLGQTISCYVWGHISDRIGRKPVLLIGLATMTLTNIMFGFSWNFGSALVSHLIGGLGNSIVPVGRTAMSEMCSSKHQAKAFAIIGSSSALGIIFGPSIGGFFTNPAVRLPSIFGQNELFKKFPFALPCIITAVMGTFGFILAFFYLKESSKIAVAVVSVIKSPCMSRRGKTSGTIKAYTKIESNESLHEQTLIATAPQDSGEDLNDLDAVETTVRAPETLENTQIVPSSILEPAKHTATPSLIQPKKRGIMDFVRDPFVMKPIISYVLLAFYSVMYEEVYILWIRSKIEENGLDFSTDKIGLALSFSGVILFFFQTFLYAHLDRWLGACKTFLLAIYITIPLYIVYPYLHNLYSFPEDVKMALVMAFFAVRMAISYQAFTAILMMVSNSVDRSEKGSLNGLIQSFASIMRFIGPAVIGYIYSACDGNPVGSLFDYHFSFYFLAIVCLGTIIYTRAYVGPSYDKPKLF